MKPSQTTLVRVPESTTQSNEIFASSSRIPIVENVSGNPATNEIEPVRPEVIPVEIPVVRPRPEEIRPEGIDITTQSPQLVTWAIVNETPSNQSSEGNSYYFTIIIK